MHEHNMIPPGHGEPDGPGAMPRCPHCATVIDTQLAAGTGAGQGRCPTHGLVTAVYGDRDAIRERAVHLESPPREHSVRVARPDYDPHIDWPERYTDGRPI